MWFALGGLVDSSPCSCSSFSFCPFSLALLEDGAPWAVPWGELRCGYAGLSWSEYISPESSCP